MLNAEFLSDGSENLGNYATVPSRIYILSFMASPRSAAAVVLVRELSQLEVFWVRRAPHMVFQGGFYAFPGGQLDPEEDARVCAARELFEEIGVRIDPTTLVE